MNRYCPPRTRLLLLLFLVVAAVRADEPAGSPLGDAVATPPSIERLGEEASRAIAQVYEYDPTIPLEARVVEKIKKDDLVTREDRVSRRAGVSRAGIPAVPSERGGPVSLRAAAARLVGIEGKLVAG